MQHKCLYVVFVFVVTNICKIKGKFLKSREMVSQIKGLHFLRLAGMQDLIKGDIFKRKPRLLIKIALSHVYNMVDCVKRRGNEAI